MSPMLPRGDRRAVSTSSANHLAWSINREVSYSCGFCGYALNLSSCNRNTTNIGSKYDKAIKKGTISFFTIDESRFSQLDDPKCRVPFMSKISWSLFRRKTRLLCRKCGNHIGDAYDENNSHGGSPNLDFTSSDRGYKKKYKIKISSLQPSDESGSLLAL